MASIINADDLTNISKFRHRNMLNVTVQDTQCSPNIVQILNARQYGFRVKPLTSLSNYHLKQSIEMKTTVCVMEKTNACSQSKLHVIGKLAGFDPSLNRDATQKLTKKRKLRSCEIPNTSRSTFLMTVSNDCSKIASAHGDHNIYVCDVITGRRLHTLSGHVRTPWTITFHPSCNMMLASGCLAGEVRVWDLQGRCTQWRTSHNNVIASLAFHPFLQVLVIAAGNTLYFWDWTQPRPFAYCCTSTALERVRFVKFVNEKLITGIANSPYDKFLKKCKSRVKCKELLEMETALKETVSAISNSGHNITDQPSSSSSADSFSIDNENKRTGSHGIFKNSSHQEFTDNRITRVINLNSSDADSSDSDNSEPGSSGISSLLNSVLHIYDYIGEACTAFETTFEKFLQENPEVREIIGPAPNDPCYMPRPLGSDRAPTTILYDMIAAVRSAINFYNVSRYPETLHDKLMQTCQSLEELSNGIDSLPDNGCHIPSDLLDYIGVFRRKRNTLIGIASEIFPHIHPHIYHPIPRDTYRSGFSNLITGSLSSRRSITSDSLHRFHPRTVYPAAESIHWANADHENSSSAHNSSQSSSSYLQEERNNSPSSSEIIYQRSENSKEFHLPRTAKTIAARAVSPSKDNIWIVTAHDHLSSIHPIQHSPSSLSSQYPSSSSRHEQRNDSSNSFQGASHSLNFSDNDQAQSSGNMMPQFPSNQKNRSSKRCQKQQQYITKKRCIDVPTAPTDILKEKNIKDTSQGIASNLHSPEQGCSSSSSSQLLSELSHGQSNDFVTGEISESNVTDISLFIKPFNSSGSSILPPAKLDPVDISDRGNRSFPFRLGSLSNEEEMYTNFAAAIRSNDNNEHHHESRRYNDAESIDLLHRRIHAVVVANASSDDEDLVGTESLDVARFPLIVDHRIQCWDFSTLTLPPIHNGDANIIVNRCMIHNDASVDISKDGDKLIALIPPEIPRDNQTFRFGIYSLKENNLGERLSVWGYVTGPVSVSFSPLGNYVVVGSAPAEHWIVDRQVIVDIIKLFKEDGLLHAKHVRGYSRNNHSDLRFADIRLNCVKWLPHMEQGFAFATNRGSLTICKPVSTITSPEVTPTPYPFLDILMAAMEDEDSSEEM